MGNLGAEIHVELRGKRQHTTPTLLQRVRYIKVAFHCGSEELHRCCRSVLSGGNVVQSSVCCQIEIVVANQERLR